MTIETMTMESPAFRFARIAAPLFGAFIIAIETWRRAHQFGDPKMWPVIFDDYLAGGFLIAASLIARRDAANGRAWLAGSWGAATGMMYGSFFIQVMRGSEPDPSGHATSQVLVVKGLMLALCVAALACSLKKPRA